MQTMELQFQYKFIWCCVIIVLIMNNQIYRVHGNPFVLHRSHRKLIWFSLPDLAPVHKHYTRSHYFSAMDSGLVMVLEQSNVVFLTVELPPLSLSEFRREFLEWQPLGGFSLSMMVILHDKHSIRFYDRTPALRQNWVIEVIQEIKELKHSLEEEVIGMMVQQKSDTIFIWKIGVVSSKPFQQVEVSQPIVKWQFYRQAILLIMTRTDLQVFSPNQDQFYNMNFFTELKHTPKDFCILDRPPTIDHSSRRSVHTVGVLSQNGRLDLYELYEMDKRIKNSLAQIRVSVDINPSIHKILCGYESKNQLILCFESESGKPITYTLNSKFQTIDYKQFSPQLSLSPESISYQNGTICVTDSSSEQCRLRLCRLESSDQFHQIGRFTARVWAILGRQALYCFNEEDITIYQSPEYGHQNRQVVKLENPNPKLFKTLVLLQELADQKWIYFLSAIRVYKLDLNQNTFKAVGFTIRNERLKLKEVTTHTQSIVYSLGTENVLMVYKVDPQSGKVSANTIRSTGNEIISLRNGRWAEKTMDKVIVGHMQNTLVTFDIGKFFKALSQDNNFYQYRLYWTTHDGIILQVKNYLFVLQLVESSQGYYLGPLKKGLTYLHHRFNPDIDRLEVLDPRDYVVREGNRVVRLGSKLGNFISEDPFALPDTVLSRQMAMRKHYSPIHPRLVSFLLEMGYFPQLSKLVMHISDWWGSDQPIDQLYSRMGSQFFGKQEGNEQKQKQVICSIEGEEQEIDLIRKVCDNILEEPHRLCLQQNGALKLESQFQSLIFKDTNSRSLDYFSAIVLTQFKTFDHKHRSFNMMHVAYMLHSINKEEAVAMLRQNEEEVSWNWMKRFSIVMWYDGKEHLKKWVEEIGTNEFKKSKEPMDCMLWYILVGKKNILATLFKKYQFNSKEHEAIFKFLQRDFADPKNKMAAGKNAFKLLDSKRYHLSLAFFIMGEDYQNAISICLSRLKDINLALLILLLTTNEKLEVVDYLMNEGDVWAKHIAYFYKAQHVDSFNCLFVADELVKLNQWEKQPQLAGFHPCLAQFAEMIEKSIPVKRQMEEQSMSHSRPAFNFYDSSEPEVAVEQRQTKQLNADYQQIKKLSGEYFCRNNCPLLCLMIEPGNRRALRAFELSNFMLTRKITPNVIQIAQEMEDILGILHSKIQHGLPVRGTVQEFIDRMAETLQRTQVSVMVQVDRAGMGKLLHYCYYSEQVLKIMDEMPAEDGPKMEEEVEGRAKQDLDTMRMRQDLDTMRILGKIILTLELQAYELLESNVFQLIRLYGKQIRMSQSEQEEERAETWRVLKKCFGAQIDQKKNKQHQIMDIFEQSLYKWNFTKKESQFENTALAIQVYESRGPAIKREYFRMVVALMLKQNKQKGSPVESGILARLMALLAQLDEVFACWVDQEARNELEREMAIMYAEGAVSKLKINFFNQFLMDKFEGVCRSLGALNKIVKKPIPTSMETLKLRDLLQMKQKSKPKCESEAREAIEIFRNKGDGPRDFAINMNSGMGLDLVILHKRHIRRLDVCQSLVNRNRNQDGLHLIHEDNFQTADPQTDYQQILQSCYPPLLAQHLARVIENRDQFDGRGIVQGSSKRVSDEYMKETQGVLPMEIGEVSSLRCHHFLPVFLAGGKGNIDLCRFSDLSNYHRFRCPGMTDIVKTLSFDQRVGAMDSAGNLSCFNFDSKLSGSCVFSLKKAGVADFCMMKPSVLGLCTNNSLQVVDTLLHPKRQVVFKYQTSQTPLAVDFMGEHRLVAARKNDVVVFDVRMNEMVESRDIGGRFRCLESNHGEKLLVGRGDNRVKVVDMDNREEDVEVKLGRGTEGNVENIRMMGKCAVAVNSDGSLYLMDVY